jgi:KipI family sensor histidine kinase inhibitor
MTSSLGQEDPVRFRPASDRSLMVSFGDRISLDIHQRVRTLLQMLTSAPISGVRNLQPGYCTLLITFDGLQLRHDELQTMVQSYIDRMDAVRLPATRQVEIPVCYGGDLGPDLDELAQLHDMTVTQAVELHSSAEYVVYFLGFVPGFAYLGGLPDALATPRLAAPRWAVPAGSVGIGGKQTAVYPVASPAGWRLIGRTPLALFSANRDAMSLLSMGDRVRFIPISREKFVDLSRT